MYKKTLFLLPCTVITLALLVFGAGFAPSIATGAAPYYVVEILVFENTVHSDAGERWDNTAAPALHDAVNPSDNSAGITELGPSQMRLADAAAHLRESNQYRVLAHKIWRQPGLAHGSAKPVRVQTRSGELNGTVQLELSYYLHLYLDLAYNPGGGADSGGFRLDQQRRIRKEEINYFDHPRFGVLAMVRS